jgi:hypothetical protein
MLRIVFTSLLALTLGVSNSANAEEHAQWIRIPHQVSVHINSAGEVDQLWNGAGISMPFTAKTQLDGCITEGAAKVAEVANKGIEVRRTLQCAGGTHQVLVVERFAPTATSIRWSVEIRSAGKPWSTPIQTSISYKASPDTRFWTAWANPDPGTGVRDDMTWNDPLTTRPMQDKLWYYGGPAFDIQHPNTQDPKKDGGLFSIPLATLLEPEHNSAVSIVFSPEDQILDATMQTTATGGILWSSLFQRLGNDRAVTFSLDLITHEADWRGGLRWISQRYPEYFNPDNPLVDQVAGGGSYSTYEGPIDAAHLRQIGFRTNWKGSFDFPYMGMFLPPVLPDVRWNRFSGGTDGNAKSVPNRYSPDTKAFNGTTSIHDLAEYSSRMKKEGFYVLNYFNTTEFGAKMVYPQPPAVIHDPANLWKDANDFFYANLKDAALFLPREGKNGPIVADGPNKSVPYTSWGGAFAMDPGEPKYQDYLIGQIHRHLDSLPDSTGFCIDRMDWLRLYNFRRDDGVSWVAGYPAQSLYNSWKQFMERLSPIVHGSGKVIFANNAQNHDKRLDIMKHFDGMYDELGYRGASLNLMAFLTIRKAAIAWTPDEAALQPDPDAFFQRHLYMGVYPTAPVPGNDHTILPSPFADKWYSDYAPLLDVMRGRKWVLTPHAIEVHGSAKVNLFTVGKDYVMPVTFGGTDKNVSITVRNVANGRYKVTVLHPGKSKPVVLSAVSTNKALSLRIPLERGCGMVKLTHSHD